MFQSREERQKSKNIFSLFLKSGAKVQNSYVKDLTHFTLFLLFLRF